MIKDAAESRSDATLISDRELEFANRALKKFTDNKAAEFTIHRDTNSLGLRSDHIRTVLAVYNGKYLVGLKDNGNHVFCSEHEALDEALYNLFQQHHIATLNDIFENIGAEMFYEDITTQNGVNGNGHYHSMPSGDSITNETEERDRPKPSANGSAHTNGLAPEAKPPEENEDQLPPFPFNDE